MSMARMDYVPFDYLRYAQEIVPALEQATQGNGQPLQALIEQAQQFSLWPRLNCNMPLAKDEMPDWSEIEGLLDVTTLRRVKAGDKVNPWDFLPKIIPTLVGRNMKSLGSYGDLLRVCLLYTFCCEMPPGTEEPTFILGDEPVFEWREYIARDEGAKALWGAFDRPAPSPLASQLYIFVPDGSDDVSTHLPRNLGYGVYEHLIGFITLEEGQDLLAHVKTREAPLLSNILSGCMRDGAQCGWKVDPEILRRADPFYEGSGELTIHNYYSLDESDYLPIYERWMKEHPEELRAFLQRYYHDLWWIEDEVLRRVQFAVSRGWGILEIWD
jgi:hypothetical protein